MVYIDFDGVILDTEDLLFYEWRKNPDRHKLSEYDKIKYIQKSDWNYIIKVSPVINDAIYYLKHMDPAKSAILTKVHSLSNEGAAKINWKKENGVKLNRKEKAFLVKAEKKAKEEEAKRKEEEEALKNQPKPVTTEDLLVEIRDLLKNK